MKFMSVIILLVLSSRTSFGFHIGEHLLVTNQAIIEFENCFPGSILSEEPSFVYASNIDEDLNVIRKDLFYSHYFNPTKTLSMYRYDSMARIQALSISLENTNPSLLSFFNLGHVIHHIQDMAVPAHVIPITHGPFEPFESYEVPNLNLQTGMNCEKLRESAEQIHDYPHLLVKAASDSLAQISKILVLVDRTDSTGTSSYQINGAAFWANPKDNSFGTFASMGNHFGETEIEFSDAEIRISQSFYDQFKTEQLRGAVVNTWIGLYLYHRPRNLMDPVHYRQKIEFSPLGLINIELINRILADFSLSLAN